MWSARRRRALGLDILAVGGGEAWDGEEGNGSNEMRKEMVDRLLTSSSSSSLSKGAFRGRDWDQSTGSCGSSD